MKILIIILALATIGCQREQDNPKTKAAAAKVEALAVAWKQDIQTCRDRGGIPIMEPPGFFIVNRLRRCDFPCRPGETR